MENEYRILDGYAREGDFAKANNINPRTVQNYRSEPDGLPFVIWGGKVFIPLADARAWLEKRVQRPNPNRRRRSA